MKNFNKMQEKQIRNSKAENEGNYDALLTFRKSKSTQQDSNIIVSVILHSHAICMMNYIIL